MRQRARLLTGLPHRLLRRVPRRVNRCRQRRRQSLKEKPRKRLLAIPRRPKRLRRAPSWLLPRRRSRRRQRGPKRRARARKKLLLRRPLQQTRKRPPRRLRRARRLQRQRHQEARRNPLNPPKAWGMRQIRMQAVMLPLPTCLVLRPLAMTALHLQAAARRRRRITAVCVWCSRASSSLPSRPPRGSAREWFPRSATKVSPYLIWMAMSLRKRLTLTR
mmetsp:Transcript_85676/g.218461  ORF Transcript_85676/g.218461 Transcript_85676/m.218461 type:complete len:218 (-) Transcript_85676:262-915(-)